MEKSGPRAVTRVPFEKVQEYYTLLEQLVENYERRLEHVEREKTVLEKEKSLLEKEIVLLKKPSPAKTELDYLKRVHQRDVQLLSQHIGNVEKQWLETADRNKELDQRNKELDLWKERYQESLRVIESLQTRIHSGPIENGEEAGPDSIPTPERSDLVRWVTRLIKNRTLPVVLLFLLASGCATSSLTVMSEPTGAEILTPSGEKIGLTPKTFSPEEIAKFKKGDVTAFTVQKDGYYPREVFASAEGDTKLSLRLSKLDEEFFKKNWIAQFPKETNTLARDLLSIQGLMMNRRLAEAERRLEEFQKQYPTVAAVWVLKATLERLRGKNVAARENLLRAKSLDPTDPVVVRLLETARQPAEEKK